MKKRILTLAKKYLQTPVAWKDSDSDGCTGVPDWIFHGCCVNHDRAYARGGIEQDRLRADQRLKFCMTQKVKDSKAWGLRWIFFYPRVHIWYAGVRLFGKAHFNYHDPDSIATVDYTKDPWKE